MIDGLFKELDAIEESLGKVESEIAELRGRWFRAARRRELEQTRARLQEDLKRKLVQVADAVNADPEEVFAAGVTELERHLRGSRDLYTQFRVGRLRRRLALPLLLTRATPSLRARAHMALGIAHELEGECVMKNGGRTNYMRELHCRKALAAYMAAVEGGVEDAPEALARLKDEFEQLSAGQGDWNWKAIPDRGYVEEAPRLYDKIVPYLSYLS